MEHLLKEKLSKVLFHGTLMDRAANILIDGIKFDKLNDRADFGKGFYLTDCYALAKSTAVARYNQEKLKNGSAYPPVVIKVKIFRHDINKYSIKEFYGEDDTWKRFICCNRWHKKVLYKYPNLDHNIDAKYDIVIGLTADGKMSTLNKMIKKDGYTLSESFLENLEPYVTSYSKIVNNRRKFFKMKAYQISIHNEFFLKHCIRFKDYDILSLRKEDGYYE